MNKKGVEIQFLIIFLFLLAVLIIVLGIIFIGKGEMFDKLKTIGEILRFGG